MGDKAVDSRGEARWEIQGEAELMLDLLALKAVLRRGWCRLAPASVRIESVAEHTFGVALLALLLCPEHLDRARVLELAVLHDLVEVEIGDIVPDDGVSSSEKSSLENRAVKSLFQGREKLKLLVRTALEEYREGRTEEARFVKSLDRYEMALQSVLYQREWRMELQEFRDSAKPSLRKLGLDPGVLDRLSQG